MIAFLQDEELLSQEIMKQIFTFINENEDAILIESKSRSQLNVPVSVVRQKLEMEDKEYDYYFNYLTSKGKTEMSESDFTAFFRDIYMRKMI